MKKSIIFIADFFSEDLIGGAELNDGVLIKKLSDKGYKITCIKSTDINTALLSSQSDSLYIISNFVGLDQHSKSYLIHNCEYIIYEHDHKYIDTRDPSVFSANRSTMQDVNIPSNHIINSRFYTRAKAVVCLSQICKHIMEQTLNCNNVFSIGTSLWSDDRLNKIENLPTQKTNNCMVVQSPNPTKNTVAGVAYCEKNNIDFDLIGGLDPDDFLETLATYKTLVYIPKVLETFCRLVMEAKMLGCQVQTVASLLGAASEKHITMSGVDLINETRQRIKNAIETFENLIEKTPEKPGPKRVAMIGKFRKLYDEEGKAKSLEKKGYEVLRFDEDTFGLSPLMNNSDVLIKYNPDLVIYAKLKVPNQNQFMVNMLRNNFTTVCWVPDLYFGTPRENEASQKFPMFHAEYVFSPDGGNQKLFEKSNINHIPLKDGIHTNNCIDIESVETKPKEIDILFVGSLNMDFHGKNRYNLLSFLQETYGDRFKWVGKNNSDEYRGTNLTNLIMSAKVVVGDCVESKNVWSNRLYETIGRGGFMIHPHVEGIEEHYTNGEHFVTFKRNNFTDLKEKIDFYLENAEERKKIISRGVKHTSEHHTLDHRLEDILDTVKEVRI